MWSRIILACILFSVPALTQIPSDLTGLGDDDLAGRTAAAVRALIQAEDVLEAERKALGQQNQELAKAMEAAGAGLPAEPGDTPEGEGTGVAALEARVKAWQRHLDARRARREFRTQAASLAEVQSRRLSDFAEKQKIVEKAGLELQSLLLEVQRRIGAGRMAAEKLQLDARLPDVGDWLDHAASVASPGLAVAAAVQDWGATVEAYREKAASAVPDEPHHEVRVRRAAAAAATMLRAAHLEAAEREDLQKLEPGTVAASMPRILDEWQRGRASSGEAEDQAAVRRRELESLDQARQALSAPDRATVPEGDGHSELRSARRNVGFSDLLIAHHQARLDLITRSAQAAAALQSALSVVDEAAANGLRSTMRLRAALALGRELQAAGRIEGFPEIRDPTEASLWDLVEDLASKEAARREEIAALEARLGDGQAAEGANRDLDAERQENQRLRAVLNEELTYAAHVEEMTRLDEERLLGMLAADGAIARNLEVHSQEAAEREKALAAAEQRVRGLRQSISILENPFTLVEIRQSQERGERIRQEVEALVDGALPEDATATLRNPPPVASGSGSPPTMPAAKDQIELARRERELLEREQSFSKEMSRYFDVLGELAAAYRSAVGDLDKAVQAHAERLSARINEEKRIHAAARELERRDLPLDRLPSDLSRRVKRDAIIAVQKSRDEGLRRHEVLRARRLQDVERLDVVLAWSPWAKTWSDLADRKMVLIGQPVAHLEAAAGAFDALPEVERKAIVYEAETRRGEEDGFVEVVLAPFLGLEERERFEEPLRAYYRERAEGERVLRELKMAVDAYEGLIEVSDGHREVLASMPASLRSVEAQRHFDYQVARHLAAIAAAPGAMARIQSEFRAQHKRDLPLPVETRDWDRRHWADQLFAAEMRLRGHLRWTRDVETRLSKSGIEADIGRYRSAIAGIGSASLAEQAGVDALAERIASLRESYGRNLRAGAVRTLVEILIIPVLAWALVRFSRRLAGRIEARTLAEPGADTPVAEKRLKTLVKVASASVAVVIWVIASIYVLSRLGVDVTPIVASASVVGIAVAFGAQALIKDFFSGFFILMENQYTLGDVVDVGGVSGLVERITLRVTVLRDGEGAVHYIPHGTVSRVANKTQDWSRVLMDVTVGYREDPDRVTKVLEDVTRRLREDGFWGPRMLDQGIVLGVEALADSAVNYRLLVKTRPGKQWDLARELRRRIKKRFEDEGIEIPYPQRVVRLVPGAEVSPRVAPEAR